MLDPGCAKITSSQTQSGQAGFSLDKFADHASVVIDPVGVEHVVVGDTHVRLALDVVEGSLLNGPVNLSVVLDDLPHAVLHLGAVQALLRLNDGSRSAMTLHRNRASNARIVAALRVYDGMAAGASHREIAIELFGDTAVNRDWSASSDFLKSRTRRLVKLARRLVSGGWQLLLQ